MVLELAYYGDSILRRKAQPVEEITEEIRQLINQMIETMIAHNGAGLAAPQVHEGLRIFLTHVSKEGENDSVEPGDIKIFINPILSNPSNEQNISVEGCLSIPGIWANVPRPERITVEWTDLDGKTHKEEFSSLQARAIMHENDHINGVLFIDRVVREERLDVEHQLRRIKKLRAPKI